MAHLDRQLGRKKKPVRSALAERGYVAVDVGGGKKVVKPAHQVAQVARHSKSLQIQHSGTLASDALTTSRTLEFPILCPTNVYAQDLAITFNVRESGGVAAVTPIPAPLFIDTIEFWANGGSLLLQTLTGDAIWELTGMGANNEQMAYLSAAANHNTSWASPTQIAISGTASYHFPLMGNFIQAHGGLSLAHIKGNIVVRIRTRASSVAAGTGVLSLTSAYLYIEAEELGSEDASGLRKLAASNIIGGDFLDVITHAIPAQTYSASSTYTPVLTSFHDIDAAFFIASFRASKSGSGAYTFVAIGANSTFTILDGNNSDLLTSGSPYVYNHYRYVELPKMVTGAMFASVNVLPIIIGDPKKALQGRHDGGIHMTANEKLYLALDSTFVSGSYSLDVIGFCWRSFRLTREGMFEKL